MYATARHAVNPVWTDWSDRLPTRPYCGDVLADGIYRRPREAALLYPHIEFNSAGCIGFMNFDMDVDDSFECWERASVPPPNGFVQNGNNGRGHLLYALREPVGVGGLSHAKPMLYAADVQRGMTRRLGADPCFVNHLAKNPNYKHPDPRKRFRVSWIAPLPYTLGDLRDALDRDDMRQPEFRFETYGIGRNCDVFDELRHYAYANGFTAMRGGATLTSWYEHLLKMARSINLGFRVPLRSSELCCIARSVAKGTWKRYSPETFRELQRRRIQRRWQGHVAASTTRPWEAEGISRRTWYYRRRQQV